MPKNTQTKITCKIYAGLFEVFSETEIFCRFGREIVNKLKKWTLNTDLKIRLPKFILDNAIMNSQFTFMGHLRKRIIELKEELSLNDSI